MKSAEREAAKLKRREEANASFQLLLTMNGGTLSAEDAAERLGTSTLRVEDLIIGKKITAIKAGKHYQIPAFQIYNGKLLPHLETLVPKLIDKGVSYEEICGFFISGGVADAGNVISIVQALRLGASEQQLFYIQREVEMFYEPGR